MISNRHTSLLNGVMVEDIDQFVFTAGFPIFCVMGSIVLQEGKINSLLILQR